MTALLEANFGALFGLNTLSTNPRWGAGAAGAPVTISYSFADTAPSYATEFSQTPFKALPEALRAVARQALAEVARLTNITFVEVKGGAPSSVSIVISGTAGGGGRASYPGGSSIAGDMYLDIATASDGLGYTSGLTIDERGDGSYINFSSVFLHELGHALGLSHPRNYPVVNGVYVPNSDGYVVKIDPSVEKLTYSIMSYNKTDAIPDGDTYDGPNAKALSYMYLDILALQALYGVNTVSSAGDTTYNFLDKNEGLVTIWDAGGRDTFDLSNQSRAAIVDLRDGGLSSIGTLAPANLTPKAYVSNVVIGPNTLIEDVVATKYADKITGNAVANRITGGGGNDDIDGGEGVDTAVYAGLSTDFSWTKATDGSWTVRDLRNGAPEGTDVLRNVEVLKFADKALALSTTFSSSVETAFAAILRSSSSTGGQSAAADLMIKIADGLTEAQTIAEIVKIADQTTSVATLSYLFFTGKIPSQPGVDYLISPT
ncbi:MAG: M10 family metallopeptidase C-terminal domain-containing protein, partial [Alphaproteobacteria bacterium]|nr:M10 family metallopeptidase C-terminal domain-containing protein [Alphaproteobacteria bacterium]